MCFYNLSSSSNVCSHLLLPSFYLKKLRRLKTIHQVYLFVFSLGKLKNYEDNIETNQKKIKSKPKVLTYEVVTKPIPLTKTGNKIFVKTSKGNAFLKDIFSIYLLFYLYSQ